IFLILCSLSGSSIQQLQSLKDSDFVAPGGTITTSCRYDSGTITDSNYPVWVQQKPEQVPRPLIHSTSTRQTGVPARFSGSRSGNTMSLTITWEHHVPDHRLSGRRGYVLLYCLDWKRAHSL
ncbi:hypothetical protein NXF25_017979, partial [Crotalus adamanteus]